MSSYLELKNITKKYQSQKDTKIVLKNIELKIKENEFLTILGPSGCGKSTLLKIIAGFIQPDSGQIFKKEQEIKNPDIDRLMLFQEFEQLFPWQTVLDNVIFAIKALLKHKKLSLIKSTLMLRPYHI